MKANLEKFQFVILSKTKHPQYNLLIDSNVIKESNLQIPCTQENKKILNIRKSQSWEMLSGFSIQLRTSKSDVLQENYFKMQQIHHKTLRIIYDLEESYINLLNLDNSVSLH